MLLLNDMKKPFARANLENQEDKDHKDSSPQIISDLKKTMSVPRCILSKVDSSCQSVSSIVSAITLDDCDFDDSFAFNPSSSRSLYATKLSPTFESPSEEVRVPIRRNSKERFESDGSVGKLPAMPLIKPVRQNSSRRLVVDLRKEQFTDRSTCIMSLPLIIPKRHISSKEIPNFKSMMPPIKPKRQIS
jgi:hypothetical protein